MPLHHDEAVCVGRWDWSETSQTLALFARELGLVRALAKGAKRERAAFSGGVDLLARGEIVTAIKPPPSMASLRSWHLVEVFPGPRASLGSFHAAMYYADLARLVVAEADPHPGLYDALVLALRSLNARSHDLSTLAMQWAALHESGHRPAVDRDVRLDQPLDLAAPLGFDPALSGLTHHITPGVWRISPSTAQVLARLDRAADLETNDDSIRRTNLLLASAIRHLLAREPPSMRALFGADLPDRP